MKKRRLGLVLMLSLVIGLCGVGTYVVYAVVNNSFRLSNTISFNAPDDVFYTADVKVKYENVDGYIVQKTLDHSGVLATHTDATELNLGDLSFTKDNKVIVYEIKITNCTQEAINVTINKPADGTVSGVTVYQNVLDVSSANLDVSGDNRTKTFTLTTTMTSTQYSFNFENSFSITFNSVSN